MIVFRQTDFRYPFLWESRDQPAGRWNGDAEGPVQYFADTPDGAWAELLRHEEIRDASDIATIRRDLWAVELVGKPDCSPSLQSTMLVGDLSTYPACRVEARRLKRSGGKHMIAPSAALLPGEARGLRVRGGLTPGPDREGHVHVLFGAAPRLVGWRATQEGHPPPELLAKVRQLAPPERRLRHSKKQPSTGSV